MKITIHTILPVAIVAMAAIFPFSPVVAQEEEAESCGVCEFEPEAIVGSINSLRELTDQMRAAEGPLRTYTNDSLNAVERGSAQALRDFSRWYRYRIDKQNKEEIQNRKIAEFLQSALELGMNYAVPGSGAVASKIRSYANRSYGAMVGQMPNGTTDPGPYIERVATSLEASNEAQQALVEDLFHDTSNTALLEQMNTVRREYVWEKAWMREEVHVEAGTPTPGPETRRLLRELGISGPGHTISDRVHGKVLARLMQNVFCESHRGNPFRNCEEYPGYFDVLGRSVAQRLLLAGDPSRMYKLKEPDHLNRVCAIERNLGNDLLGMGPECRNWLRNH